MIYECMKMYFLTMCLCLSICAYGYKEDYSGTYVCESGARIEIKGDAFIYTEHLDHMPIWYNDTLSVCKIKRVDKHVLEISSLDSFYDVYRTMEISSSKNDFKSDSIEVSFQFPYSFNDLNISISTGDKNYYNNISRRHVNIPKGTKKITFTIFPQKGGAIHTVYGQSYGVMYLQSFDEDIAPDADSITIKLPLLDNHFFEKYLITREYVYIDGDRLYWKDMNFKRINNDISVPLKKDEFKY